MGYFVQIMFTNVQGGARAGEGWEISQGMMCLAPMMHVWNTENMWDAKWQMRIMRFEKTRAILWTVVY